MYHLCHIGGCLIAPPSCTTLLPYLSVPPFCPTLLPHPSVPPSFPTLLSHPSVPPSFLPHPPSPPFCPTLLLSDATQRCCYWKTPAPCECVCVCVYTLFIVVGIILSSVPACVCSVVSSAGATHTCLL